MIDMGIFDSGKPSHSDTPRGTNGNVRDTRSEHRHAAVDETPHLNAVRRTEHQPKHLDPNR